MIAHLGGVSCTFSKSVGCEKEVFGAFDSKKDFKTIAENNYFKCKK